MPTAGNRPSLIFVLFPSRSSRGQPAYAKSCFSSAVTPGHGRGVRQGSCRGMAGDAGAAQARRHLRILHLPPRSASLSDHACRRISMRCGHASKPIPSILAGSRRWLPILRRSIRCAQANAFPCCAKFSTCRRKRYPWVNGYVAHRVDPGLVAGALKDGYGSVCETFLLQLFLAWRCRPASRSGEGSCSAGAVREPSSWRIQILFSASSSSKRRIIVDCEIPRRNGEPQRVWPAQRFPSLLSCRQNKGITEEIEGCRDENANSLGTRCPFSLR